MIKKIIVGLAILTSISILSVSLFAGESKLDSKKAIQKETLDMSSDKDQIKKVIANCSVKEDLVKYKDDLNLKINSKEDLEFGIPYKVVLSNPDIMKKLTENKAIKDLLDKADYFWEVPVVLKSSPNKAVASFSIDKTSNSWQVVELGGFLPTEEMILSSNQSKITSTLKDNDLVKAEKVVHFRVPSINKDYIYVLQDNSESFIPLTTDLELKTKSATYSKHKAISPKDTVKNINEIGKH